MAAKKLLSQILLERTETIEFRKIRSQLMNIAQNRGREMRILKLDPDTITMLENQGIKIDEVNEHGYNTLKLSW